MAWLLVGCVSSDSRTATSRSVVVAMSADVPDLQPALTLEATLLYQVLPNLYDPLFRRDRENKVQPFLAESFTAIDSTTWDIALRQNIKFQDGELFDASSVKHTLDFILDPANKSQLRPNLDQVASVSVVDPQHVRIKTKRPMPTLIPQLTEVYMLPAGTSNDLRTSAVGTGPFKLVSWTRGQDIVLEAKADYWGGRPKIDRLIFRPIPEASSRVAALQAREAHIAINVPPSVGDQLAQSGARLQSVAGRRVIYVGFDTLNAGPLQKREVRLAINHAVDTTLIIKHTLQGFASRMAGPLPAVNQDVNADVKPYSYDPALAKQLLNEAGFPDGFSIALYAPSGRYVNDKEVAEAIAAQLRAVNIKADLQVVEWGTYLEMVRSHRAPGVAMHLLGRSDRLYEGSILSSWFKTGQTYVTYSNPDLDQQLDAAAQLTESDQRRQSYDRIQQAIRDDAPWLFLYSQHDLYGIGPGVHWEPRSDELVSGMDMSYGD